MKQEILKFNFKFKSKEFFVSKKNYFAYDFIKKWPNWETQFVYIYGPEKCGKTSISKLWEEVSNAIYLSKKNFNQIINNQLDINYIKNNNWILDDVDKLIQNKNKYNSSKVLNLINIIKENSKSFLLMTGNKAPKYIGCNLDDLTSRLLSSVVLEVADPDENLLCKIIEKYLSDRNIYLSEKYLIYILQRIERSYESALDMAKKIDQKSLESKSKISLNFLRKLLEN